MRPFLLLLLLSGCATGKAEPPERPASVPASARWAGGVDGGHWFDCARVPGAPAPRAACRIYGDQAGHLEAQGEFLLVRDSTRPGPDGSIVGAPAESFLVYESYDGDVIQLAAGFALVPDGVIDHPFGDGHGKRQSYSAGRATGPEVSY